MSADVYKSKHISVQLAVIAVLLTGAGVGVCAEIAAEPSATAERLGRLRQRYDWGGLYLTSYDLVVLHNAALRSVDGKGSDFVKFTGPGALRIRSFMLEQGSDFRSHVACIFFDLATVKAGYLSSRGSTGIITPLPWTHDEVVEAADWGFHFLQARQTVQLQLNRATEKHDISAMWKTHKELATNPLYIEEDREALAAVIGANLAVDERQTDKLRKIKPKEQQEIIAFQLAYAKGVGSTGRLSVGHGGSAVPVYQDYVARAQVSEAFLLMTGVKVPVTEFYVEHERWPTSLAETGIADLSATERRYVENRTIDPENGVITLTYKNDGSRFTLTPTVAQSGISWTCKAPDVANKYVPAACR